MASESEIRSAHSRAVGGKPKRCQKGKNCSAACIERNDVCLIEISPSVSNTVTKYRDAYQSKPVEGPPVSKVTTKKLAKELYSRAAIAAGNGDRDIYEKVRQDIIKHNQLIVGQKAEGKVGLLGVPMKWEKLQRIKGKLETTLSATRNDIKDLIEGTTKGRREALTREEKYEFFNKLQKALSKLDKLESLGGKVGIDSSREGVGLHKAYFKHVFERIISPEIDNAARRGKRTLYEKLSKLALDLINTDKSGGYGRVKPKGIAIGYGIYYDPERAWKFKYESRVQGKMLDVSYDLKSKMQKAFLRRDRKAYDRAESSLLKLDKRRAELFPDEKFTRVGKGEIWKKLSLKRFGKIKGKVTKLLEGYAKAGDWNNYKKWESRLLKLQRRHGSAEDKLNRGEIWKKARFEEGKAKYNELKAKLLNDMELAISAKKRKVYDSLENRLLSLQGKGADTFGDTYTLKKGELWDKFSKSSHSLGKLDPLSNSQEFANTLNSTKGMYQVELKRINDYISKLLGIKTPLPGEQDKYNGILRSIRDRIGGPRLEAGIMSIRSFTANDYKRIRAAQKRNNKNSPFYMDGVHLEVLLNLPELEKPNVVKFRGMSVNDKKLQGLIDAASQDKPRQEKATSSWSTSLDVAKSFSGTGLGIWGDNRVIFRTVNTRGIPVENLSSVKGEYEILTSRSAAYKTLNYRTIEHDGQTYHVFDLVEL